MSSRLFKSKMAMSNRPPVYPELFVGAVGTPYEALYKYDSQMTLTPYPTPADVISTVQGFAVRKDGKFVGICHANKFQLYRRNNGAFTRVTITGDTGTAVNAQDARFSDDGNFLLVAYQSSPSMLLHQRNADDSGYTIVPGGITGFLSSYGVFGASFSPDGQHVAMAQQYNPYLKLSAWNGSKFATVLTTPTLYGAQINDVSYSPDGQYLALATYNGVCNLQILKNNFDGSYTKLTDTNGKAVGGAARGVRFSPDGQHIALATANSPYLVIYKWDGAALTRLTNVPATMASAGWRVDYSADGNYLAIVLTGGAGLPIAHVFQRSSDTYTELAQVPMVGSAGRGIQWGPPPT